MEGQIIPPIMGIDRFQKRAVKVLKPPGGDCHDIFGGDYGEEVASPLKPPVPHCSSVSSGEMEQTLEKILKPPGGGSSDIFGTTSAQENSARAAEYKIKNAGNDTSSRIFGLLESQEIPRKSKTYLKSNIFQESVPQHGAAEPVTHCTKDDAATNTVDDVDDDCNGVKSTESLPAGAGDGGGEMAIGDGKKRNAGLGNPITGEGYKADDIETEKCIRHPQVRVRNPPGGPSTKLW